MTIVHEYFETFLSNGFLPKISLRTRLTQTSATLIDNNYVKLSNNFSESTSGSLHNNISDRQPFFVTHAYFNMSVTPQKYTTIRTQSTSAINNFIFNLGGLTPPRLLHLLDHPDYCICLCQAGLALDFQFQEPIWLLCCKMY